MWRLGKNRRWPGDFKRILPYSRGPGPDSGLWGSVPALTPCQIREKLSPPINFSVSFSHPCCEGVWGLGWDQQQLPLHPPCSDLHEDNLLWVWGAGSQSPGLWHHNNPIENKTHSSLSWSTGTCQATWWAPPYHISFILKMTICNVTECYDFYFTGEHIEARPHNTWVAGI